VAEGRAFGSKKSRRPLIPVISRVVINGAFKLGDSLGPAVIPSGLLLDFPPSSLDYIPLSS